MSSKKEYPTEDSSTKEQRALDENYESHFTLLPNVAPITSEAERKGTETSFVSGTTEADTVNAGTIPELSPEQKKSVLLDMSHYLRDNPSPPYGVLSFMLQVGRVPADKGELG